MATYQRSIPIPGKTSDEIYTRIVRAIDQFQAKDTGRFGKFEFHSDPAAKTVRLESSHATAELECRDGEVNLKGKLSFLASAFRGKIDSGINEWIASAFKS